MQLLATDPGPLTSLYFDGAADTLIELRELLLSILEHAERLPGVGVQEQAALVPEMLPVMERIGRGGRAEAQRIRTTIERGVQHVLEANCSVRGLPQPAPAALPDRSAATMPPVALPASAAPADPHPAQSISAEDLSHLAEVIAEERHQLMQSQTPRRFWHGTTTT